MQDVYENIEGYNPSRKCNVLMVFDDTIADIISNKKLNQIVTEIFIRVPKDVRLNSTHYFIMKIPNKQELQQIILIIHWILTLKTS